MTDPLALIYLVGGIVYLFLGGDLMVRGSISIARRYRISPAVIGATIVAFGTSAPELITSLLAALRGAGAIATGNVVGSNIANVLLVLGLPALVSPVATNIPGLRPQALFMLGVTVVFCALSLGGSLDARHGALLLGVLVAAIWLSFSGRLPILDLSPEEESLERVLGLPENQRIAWGFVVFGAIAMPLGARLTVNGAVSIAQQLGIPEEVIAASIIAAGTSLPELSATISAAMHRQAGMAVGNVLGSNLFNILLVIGVTASVAPLPVTEGMMRLDLWVMLVSSAMLAATVFLGWTLGRRAGALMLGAYLLYLAALYGA